MSKILPVTYELNYKIELQIATCRLHIYKEIWVPHMADISPLHILDKIVCKTD